MTPVDLCPEDPEKTEPGICGCGIPDSDENLDGIADCLPIYPPEPPVMISPEEGEVMTGESVTFKASPFSDPDGHSHIKTRWQFREAGKGYDCPTYPDAFEQEIDSGDLTRYELTGVHSGKTYFGKVCYIDSAEGESCSDEFSFRAGLIRASDSLRIEPGETAADFKMVSFPMTPEPADAAALFRAVVGDYDPSRFRIGGYDPVKGRYVEYGQGLTIEPGRAYWFLAREGALLNLSGNAVSRNHDVEVPLRYNPGARIGWNMIGPPNGRDYDWNGVEVVVYGDTGESGGACSLLFGPTPVAELGENPYLDTRLWRWENGAYRSDTRTLSLNRGCWVKAKAANVVLRFRAEGGRTADRLRIQQTWGEGIGWLKDRLLPRMAAADVDDGPPAPPAGLAETDQMAGSGGGSSGCFIQNAADSVR